MSKSDGQAARKREPEHGHVQERGRERERGREQERKREQAKVKKLCRDLAQDRARARERRCFQTQIDTHRDSISAYVYASTLD